MQTKNFLNNKEFKKLSQRLGKEHNQIKPNLSNAQLQFIALVIVRFQRIELSIRDFITYLLSLHGVNNKIVKILTVGTSFKELIKNLEDLAVISNLKNLEDLKQLLKMATQAEQIRNQIVHSYWTNGPRIKMSKKNPIKYEFKLYTEEERKEIPEQMYRIYNGIEALKFFNIEENLTASRELG